MGPNDFPSPAPLASRSPLWYRRLVGLTVVLTFGLIMLGAFVRLTDAGLGCPDWPGCYGQITPLHASEQIARAVAEQGGEHGPVSMGKAWREMIHRYVAKILGLLIIAIAVVAWRRRRELGQSPTLPILLVGVVILQGLFGMWTVTLLLRPAVVTGHLLGGMLTFSLLLWLWLRQQPQPRYLDPEPASALAGPALAGLVLVSLQIFLGGWTSTNYAALVCPDLPTCQGQWWPEADFANAFHFFGELGMTGDGEPLTMQALTAIHLMHRIGALIVFGGIGWLGLRVMNTEGLRRHGIALLAILCVQLLLGLSNVWFDLPLPVAVAHNGGAALLLAALVVLNFRARRARLQI
jgi:cytochrome c oxidase assembly protein subunit 15